MQKLIIIGRGRGADNGLRASGEKWAVCVPRPGVDIMFSMHPDTDQKSQTRQQQARLQGIEVMNPGNYPIDQIVQRFKSKYFPESISYMIAMGIHRGFDVIDLYGCNANPGKDDHIIPKRPGVDYWIGRAQGMGIEIRIDGETCMFEPAGGLYGY